MIIYVLNNYYCRLLNMGLDEYSIKILRFVFDYGFLEFNLFKYVVEEVYFLWEKVKKLFIFRD